MSSYCLIVCTGTVMAHGQVGIRLVLPWGGKKTKDSVTHCHISNCEVITLRFVLLRTLKVGNKENPGDVEITSLILRRRQAMKVKGHRSEKVFSTRDHEYLSHLSTVQQSDKAPLSLLHVAPCCMTKGKKDHSMRLSSLKTSAGRENT